jgi:hypothetical protein
VGEVALVDIAEAFGVKENEGSVLVAEEVTDPKPDALCLCLLRCIFS